jgi:hypothetical protein
LGDIESTLIYIYIVDIKRDIYIFRPSDQDGAGNKKPGRSNVDLKIKTILL